MANTQEGQEFWLEFIELYKSFPCLWKIKSDEYKNRNLKTNCYLKLLEKMKERIPNATKDTVTKKVNSFRTSYRRELKKVLKSEKSGSGSEDIYIPSLWFYGHLSFLRDQDIQTEGISTLDIDDEVRKNLKAYRPVQ